MTRTERVEHLLLRDEPMSRHTTLGIGGPADFYAVASTKLEMLALVTWSRGAGIPARVIGGGANLLVSDAGVCGLIIENRISGCTVNLGRALVLAGSGLAIADLAAYTIASGLGGLEWAVGLPGTLGGAVVGNAGAFGGYMDQVVRSVTVLTTGGQTTRWDAGACGFTYRGSRFKGGQQGGTVILDAELQLEHAGAGILELKAQGFMAKRDAGQPWEPSAGSVFKRTAEHPAGWLIEQAGLKGRKVGGAQISTRHANFIVNNGSATARDVLALINLARETVKRQFGVDLELEIEMVGSWQ
jgi:UDP-N-acetylmuramate dehydrogenase